MTSGETFGAEVIHQNDLFQEVRRGPVEHAVHGAKQRGPHFIHEAEDHAGGRQVVVDQSLRTSGGGWKNTQNQIKRVGSAGDEIGEERGTLLTSPAWCPGWHGPRGSGCSGRR